MAKPGAALAGSTADPGAVLAVRLAALTGLPIGEVRAIRWADVDLATGRLAISQSKTGARIHSLPPAALSLLADAPRLGPCVIPGRDPGKPLDARLIRRVFADLAAAAGVPDARPHDLRRTVATRAVEGGANVTLLRDLLGHRTLAMAGRHARQAGAPLIDLRDRVGGLIAAQLEGRVPAEVAPLTPARRSGATE